MSQRSDVTLPAIPLDLWSHKRSITIHWTIILIANCILPIALYFSLKKHTSLHTELILSIILPIIGLPALATLFKRFLRLYRNEDARPTTSRSRWAFDFFQWNFTVGVVYITIVLVLGSTSANVRLVALMIPLSILQTCTQLVLTEVLFIAKLAIPFPLSSFEAGSRFPPGVIVIAEDICAVDGACGRQFRSALVRRIASSPALENVSRQLDWMWGVSGLLVAGTLLAVIFGAENPEIGYALCKLSRTSPF
ncbi:hypothetical protein BU24DRAFT_157572 [Aaosphaeria arxii CBS 175.79]|uniref:Uncharacterized protein n=1 Tax=Aaosphaeria arxii CBS 175.79 TaxID=1450172 RepID=A0A6A5XX55_9PLEO|nr:uncharacterized protein BU24DRAFT_157572 [Aaosphaeria arxii CBS 175.79]KAF2017742.1 hypothetical protein BU24DRAFT_157572 [Aaosphaeria arxii CBS 175.79]